MTRLILATIGLLLPLAMHAASPPPAAPPQPEDPPFVLPAGVQLTPDVAYAEAGGEVLRLDLYRPEKSAGPHPAAVFVHGGGWSAGDKSNFRRQAARLAARGFVTVSINYRLAPRAEYPAALHDCKAAVRWLRAHARDYGVDPDRIAAVGGSAGGQLVALLGTTADRKEFEGEVGVTGVSSRVAAVVAFNPVVDLVPVGTGDNPEGRSITVGYLGCVPAANPARWAEASPINHVRSGVVPFLILHGNADRLVPYPSSVEMVRRLQAAGGRAELFTATGAPHGFYHAPPWFEPATGRMIAFLERELGAAR